MSFVTEFIYLFFLYFEKGRSSNRNEMKKKTNFGLVNRCANLHIKKNLHKKVEYCVLYYYYYYYAQ